MISNSSHSSHTYVHDEKMIFSSITDLYFKYEKFILPLFVATVISLGFYYIDWHNAVLWKDGMTFHHPLTWMDTSIPFISRFIWVYLFFFPFAFSPILVLKSIDTFRRVAIGYLYQYLIAFLMFILYPTRIVRPDVAVHSFSTQAVAMIYRIDPGFNDFPSMHVANSWFVALIFYRYNKKLGILFMFIASLISVSTLYVKQHYLIDIPAGILDALLVYYVVFRGHVPEHKRLMKHNTVFEK